jgi:hypothetical protein
VRGEPARAGECRSRLLKLADEDFPGTQFYDHADLLSVARCKRGVTEVTHPFVNTDNLSFITPFWSPFFPNPQ